MTLEQLAKQAYLEVEQTKELKIAEATDKLSFYIDQERDVFAAQLGQDILIQVEKDYDGRWIHRPKDSPLLVFWVNGKQVSIDRFPGDQSFYLFAPPYLRARCKSRSDLLVKIGFILSLD